MSKELTSVSENYHLFLKKNGCIMTCVCLVLVPYIIFFPHRLREGQILLSDLMALTAFVGTFAAFSPYLIDLNANNVVTIALSCTIGAGIGCLCALFTREPAWMPIATHGGILWKIIVIDMIRAFIH